MENSLSMLRKYTVEDKAVSMKDGFVYFGDGVALPEDTKTNFVVYGTGKDGAPKEYYTLKSVVFLLQKIEYQHAIYVREAVSENITAVRRPDRRGLLSYLRGEIDTCGSIDKFAQPDNVALTKPALVPTASSQVGEARKSADEGAHDNVKRAQYHMDTEKFKAQLAAKLSETKENCVTTQDLKSLSEAMTVERIAAIKAKRIAKKRTMISTLDDDFAVQNADMGAPKSLGLGNNDAMKNIMAHERNYRERTTMLQSKTKEFATSVFSILDSITKREASEKPGYQPTTLNKPAATRLTISNNHRQSYNRYDQERFAKHEEMTSGFKIQTTASYHGSTIQALINTEMPQIIQPTAAPTSLARPTTAVVPIKKKRPSTTPIIIVPSSAQSLITTFNATEILQELRFVSNDAKRASCQKRESDFLIQRNKSGGLTVPYRIVDNPLRLQAEDWQRVVAVFVLGPTWQFKGWPVYGGNPVEIFSHITAFHLKYDDVPVPANVAGWAVTMLNVSRTKRHLDKAALLKFWETLDKSTIKKRTQLRL